MCAFLTFRGSNRVSKERDKKHFEAGLRPLLQCCLTMIDNHFVPVKMRIACIAKQLVPVTMRMHLKAVQLIKVIHGGKVWSV